MNEKPEVTLPAVHCIYVIKFQLESLLSTYHIFSYFDFHLLFPLFSCKAPRLAFSFLPPVRFEIFRAGFSSRIFIFPLVHWLRKSDYSSLIKTRTYLEYFIMNSLSSLSENANALKKFLSLILAFPSMGKCFTLFSYFRKLFLFNKVLWFKTIFFLD